MKHIKIDKNEEALAKAAREYQQSIEANNSQADAWDFYGAFIAGAAWVKRHPNAIDMSYLQNWYQDSIDETKEPIWTDQHLEELLNDFYLIPKSK